MAAQLQGLLASVLQLLAVLLALAGLLGHELTGTLSFRGVLAQLAAAGGSLAAGTGAVLLCAQASPLVDHPAGSHPRCGLGLSPDLDPLSITELALVDGTAARFAAEEQPCRRMLLAGVGA